MAQTLVKLYIHIIFSTKNRANLILPATEDELFSYIGNSSKLLAANGTENHIHLLVSMSKNIELSKLVGAIKRDSSKWIKIKSELCRQFQWQDGYGAFSVAIPKLKR